MLAFACLVPHAPIFLPNTGSPSDRQKVKKTIASLEKLGQELAKIKLDELIISSPHPNWGFEVPLHFLTQQFKPTTIKPILTDLESPQVHFGRGQEFAKKLHPQKTYALVASGDMSHKMKKDGPYGLHPSGLKFDQEFIRLLKTKDIQGILKIDPRLIEEAGECGLRSFCLALGMIEKLNWQPEILSYEGPFGVGYLVARLL